MAGGSGSGSHGTSPKPGGVWKPGVGWTYPHGVAPFPDAQWQDGTGWVRPGGGSSGGTHWNTDPLRNLTPAPKAGTSAPPTKTTTTTPTTTTPTTPPPAQTDPAFQTILGVLLQGGLTDPAFATIAWNDYKSGRTDSALILSDIRGSDAYKTAFPNADKLLASGIISNEGQYLNALNTYRDLNHRYGLPATYDSAEDITTLLLGHVSSTEYEQRLSLAQQASLAGIDPTTRSELLRNVPGLTPGDLTAVYLNPNEDLGHLQQGYQAALIGAQADLTGFGQVGTGTLADLAARGVSTSQAQQGFGQLAADRNLFTALPGETPGASLDQQGQISAVLGGNAQAQATLDLLRRQRLGQFQNGGAAATSQQGAVGLAPNQT